MAIGSYVTAIKGLLTVTFIANKGQFAVMLTATKELLAGIQ